jgi:hypothetical protein
MNATRFFRPEGAADALLFDAPPGRKGIRSIPDVARLATIFSQLRRSILTFGHPYGRSERRARPKTARVRRPCCPVCPAVPAVPAFFQNYWPLTTATDH